MSTIPQEVLSQQLGDVLDGRRVRVALFTTFSFDPAFFELHVLPLLFTQSFSQADKIKRVQIDNALRDVEQVAVYYDHRALAQDGEPAWLGYARLDVSRSRGYFHPKVVLLLVDEPVDEAEGPAPQALIVGILSANLTRQGWWENVECAHFEEIKESVVDDSRWPFRPDLLSLIRRLKESVPPDDDQSALERIHVFLTSRTQRERHRQVSSRGRFHTKIFCGQRNQDLAGWLRELRVPRGELNLEVVSPFFDETGAGPLADIIDALEPREARVYLPTAPDGSAEVTRETYDAVAELAEWSHLPPELVNRGRNEAAERQFPRRVHAKVYRLWRRDGPDLLIVGSPNLTSAGHSHAAAGNLEAAFLVDVAGEGYGRRWWLEPNEREYTRFAETAPAEDDGLDTSALALSIRYDWAAKGLAYRLGEPAEAFEVHDPSGPLLFVVDRPRVGRWIALPEEAADNVCTLLRSTSFLLVKMGNRSWRVLIREENIAHRPSLLLQLTPEEILEYWSQLTPEQQAHFLELRIVSEIEGLAVTRTSRLQSRDTLFDHFAGVYHAFGCLRRHVEKAISENRDGEAEARLLGAKYDSLPSLLDKSLADPNADAIMQYVTFLCATQLVTGLRRERKAFFRSRTDRTGHLDELLARLPEVRQRVEQSAGADARAFLEWYEEAFLTPVAVGADT